MVPRLQRKEHWDSRPTTGTARRWAAKQRHFFGVIATVCTDDGIHIPIPLAFEPVADTKDATTLPIFKHILESYHLTEAFSKNKIPVSCDNALYRLLKNETAMSISCGSHNMSLLLNRTIEKEAPKVMGEGYTNKFKDSSRMPTISKNFKNKFLKQKSKTKKDNQNIY